ncbi:helix-turn-helix domain-containing protein [Halorubrum sp. CBA1125]|uniref:winged helix-turn-helix domain-containing protein n=1 Tax=Halorubrum sp. CBA1125 TaxID=2668072 RepID=UPI0012E75A02|nr:helix-turn-helix domain-containing protein [Halorubrum sp. CBA1125]MUW14012.1 helix-turn-helix domain-containing protein [Halorubrum sp. CBA1125]
MKRPTPQAAGPTTVTEDTETLDETFDALADPDCRAILAAADAPMTTSELADACDIALSTAYRKVERLSQTPLLTEGVRFDPNGDHAAEYARAATDAAVELTDDGVTLTVDERGGTDALEAALETTGVSAD